MGISYLEIWKYSNIMYINMLLIIRFPLLLNK